MKKLLITVVTLLCLAVAALSLTGCASFPNYVIGTGNVDSKQYAYQYFTNVEISNAFEFEINQGNTYSVVISAHENIMNYLDISQSGKTLVIQLKSGSFTHADTKAVITMPELFKIDVSGASRGSAKGFKSAAGFDARVSGASQLELDMESGKTNLNISGAGKVTGNLKAQVTRLEISGASQCALTGSAGATDIEVSGASQANIPEMQLQSADVNVSGASRATIKTNGTLNVEATGASHVDYFGNPVLNNINVSGASGITNK